MLTRRNVVLPALAAAVAALSSACSSSGGPSGSGPTPPATGKAISAQSTSLGTILVDGRGRTVYVFANDKTNVSTCDGACAADWPPVQAPSPPGTAARRDGRTRHHRPVRRHTSAHRRRPPALHVLRRLGRRADEGAGHHAQRGSLDRRLTGGRAGRERGGPWHSGVLMIAPALRLPRLVTTTVLIRALGVVTAALLAIDAYVHLRDAGLYDGGTGITEGALFRVRGLRRRRGCARPAGPAAPGRLGDRATRCGRRRRGDLPLHLCRRRRAGPAAEHVRADVGAPRQAAGRGG